MLLAPKYLPSKRLSQGNGAEISIINKARREHFTRIQDKGVKVDMCRSLERRCTMKINSCSNQRFRKLCCDAFMARVCIL